MTTGRVERMLELARGSTWKHLKEARTGQWLDLASSRFDQERRVSALLQHAATHVPCLRRCTAATHERTSTPLLIQSERIVRSVQAARRRSTDRVRP